VKKWYVIQVYAGYDDSIKTDLERRIKAEGLEEKFGQVLIPSAKLKQMFEDPQGKDSQLFPGYILVEMELLPETIRLVTSNPRVVKFLGGKDPASLSKKEIERVLGQVKGEVAVAAKKSDFVVGSEIEVKDGPFAGFVGIIDKIDEENERLTVMVSIFGRMTPVELSFSQIQ